MPYGLPTFPIANGMVLGNREPEEYEWLLKHGVFHSNAQQFLVIKKTGMKYQLIKQDAFLEDKRTLAEYDSLQELEKNQAMSIYTWRWIGNFEDTSHDH